MSHDFSTQPHLSVAAWTTTEDAAGDRTLPSKRYRVDLELGRGGMGVVRSVTDLWLNRQVAMKHPRDKAHVARVLREAAITARLNHPTIPPIFDVGSNDEGPFYTMPVLVGLPFDTAPLSLVERVHRLRSVAEALAHAHQRGIVHRDVKPDNVLCGESGEVWLVDWGIAWDALDPDTNKVGTVGFAAPEQTRGSCGPRSDVFAMGCMLRRVAEGDAALEAIATRASTETPEERYPDASTMAQELSRWLEGQRVEAYAYSGTELVQWYLRRYRWPLIGVALTCAVLGVILVSAGVAVMQEQRSTSQALATTLAWQAGARAQQGARAESELLAAMAQAEVDHPRARGVQLRWSTSPAPLDVLPYRALCNDVQLQWDGRGYCPSTGDILDVDGQVIGNQPFPDVEWDPRTSRVHLIPDGLVVLSSSLVTRVEQGQLTAWKQQRFPLSPQSGEHPAFLSENTVVQLHSDGDRTWQSSCPPASRPRPIATSSRGVVVGCEQGDGQNRVELFSDRGRQELDPGGSPASLAWTEHGVAVGRWDKVLALWDGESWSTHPVPDVAVQLEPFGPDGLLVRLERGPSRLFHLPTRRWVYTFPSGADALSAVQDRVRWRRGDQILDYRLPADLAPSRLHAVREGGVDSLGIPPDGRRLATGHSSGKILVWNLDTHAVEEVGTPGPNTVKALEYDSKGHLWAANDLPLERPQLSQTHLSRRFERVGDKIFAVDFGGGLSTNVDGRALGFPDPGEVTGIDEDNGALWALGAAGLTRDGEGVQAALESGLVSVSERGVFVTQSEGSLWGLGYEGDVRWTQEGPVPITTIDAAGDWVVAGYRDGSIRVFASGRGTLLAELELHSRRVSEVRVHEDALFTASWDGLAVRLDLSVLRQSPATLDAVEARWGLTLESLRATGR